MKRRQNPTHKGRKTMMEEMSWIGTLHYKLWFGFLVAGRPSNSPTTFSRKQRADTKGSERCTLNASHHVLFLKGESNDEIYLSPRGLLSPDGCACGRCLPDGVSALYWHDMPYLRTGGRCLSVRHVHLPRPTRHLGMDARKRQRRLATPFVEVLQRHVASENVEKGGSNMGPLNLSSASLHYDFR